MSLLETALWVGGGVLIGFSAFLPLIIPMLREDIRRNGRPC